MAYFQELDAILKSGKAGEHSDKASKTLASYTRHLSLIGMATKLIAPFFAAQNPELAATISMAGEGVNQIGEVTRKASEALKDEVADHSLSEIKKLLFEAMGKLERPILVVIDDIDRLSESEILEVFQLVKINADFPKLIYLLLFDRPVVCEALNKISSNRGKQYLEKIVQVSLSCPEVVPAKIREILFKGLDESMEAPGVLDRWDKDRWSSLFLDGMAAYFKNLRLVYRFLASFDFQVRHFQRQEGFEVNPIDLLGLETLRIFESELYEKLFSHKALLTGDYGSGLWSEKKEEDVREDAKLLLSVVSDATRPFAKHIVQTVFPSSSGKGRDGYSVEQWLREARVCHAEIFDKYFTLQIDASDLGQIELEQLVKFAGETEKFIAAMREIERRGLVDKAMDRLEAYKEEIPLPSMSALTLALCDCADSFSEKTPGFFDFNSLVHAYRIIYFGLRREPDTNKRFDILNHAIKETSGVVLPVRIVSGEERRKKEEEPNRQYLIDESQIEHLKRLCLDNCGLSRATENLNLQITEQCCCGVGANGSQRRKFGIG